MENYMPRATAFDVFDFRVGPNGFTDHKVFIETVFYCLSPEDGDPCEYVRKSLIADDYAPSIEIKRHR
jgi:hypothetical protein